LRTGRYAIVVTNGQATTVRAATDNPLSRRDFAAENASRETFLGLARGVCMRCLGVFRRSALALTVVGVVCHACRDATRARQVELGERDLYQLRTLGIVVGQHW